MKKNNQRKRVLAVSSGGGHWVELMRLRPAFDDNEVTYATVKKSYATEVPGAEFYVITDANRWSRWSLLKMMCGVLWIVVKERPDIVISTGAAPGAAALRFGKWVGARTVWIDSIANIECTSMSGSIASRFADLALTQWEHLAGQDGLVFQGRIL